MKKKEASEKHLQQTSMRFKHVHNVNLHSLHNLLELQDNSAELQQNSLCSHLIPQESMLANELANSLCQLKSSGSAIILSLHCLREQQQIPRLRGKQLHFLDHEGGLRLC